jgi:hypothetical protein
MVSALSAGSTVGAGISATEGGASLNRGFSTSFGIGALKVERDSRTAGADGAVAGSGSAGLSNATSSWTGGTSMAAGLSRTTGVCVARRATSGSVWPTIGCSAAGADADGDLISGVGGGSDCLTAMVVDGCWRMVLSVGESTPVGVRFFRASSGCDGCFFCGETSRTSSSSDQGERHELRLGLHQLDLRGGGGSFSWLGGGMKGGHYARAR